MKQWTTGIGVIAAVTFASAAQLAAAQPGKSPVKVFILAGQSNMEGQAVVDLDHEKYYNSGKGNLEHVMKNSPKAHLYAHLKDKAGKWVLREEFWVWEKAGKWVRREDVRVWYKTERSGLKKGRLGIGYTAYPGKHHFGPELQFGHVMGNHFDNQVLLIKTAWGGKSLYQGLPPAEQRRKGRAVLHQNARPGPRGAGRSQEAFSQL